MRARIAIAPYGLRLLRHHFAEAPAPMLSLTDWRGTMRDQISDEVHQSLTELFDAATALREAVEKAKPIIDAIEARWGKDVWERHRKSRTE